MEDEEAFEEARRRWGLLAMLAEALVLAMLALVVKLLKSEFGSFELVFFRSCIIFLGTVVTLSVLKLKPWAQEGQALLIFRACVGWSFTSSYFYTLHRLPLCDTVSIIHTSPVITALGAALLLHEPWGILDALGCVLSMTGVFLIVKPDFLASFLDVSPSSINPAGLVGAILGAFLTSSVYLLTRVMKTLHPVVILNYVNGAGVVLSPLGAYLTGEHWSRHGFRECIVMSLVAALSVTSQSLIYVGLSRVTAARATAMNYAQVVFALLFQILILHEPTDPLSVTGAVLIVTWGVIALVKEHDHEKELHDLDELPRKVVGP